MLFTAALTDERDALKLGGATVEIALNYVVHRGDPGYRRDANGDGCPPTPDEAELIAWTVLRVIGQLGPIPDWQADRSLLERVKSWAAKVISDQWEVIEGWLLADAEEVA